MLEEITKWATDEREYIIYKTKFVKRSLAPHEYKESIPNPQFYANRNNIRLRNEAECLRFIKEKTEIPVPEVLNAYEQKDGSFILETKLIDGVEMERLSPEEQETVKPQIRRCVEMLRSLRSDSLGGPSGIFWPPHSVVTRPDGPTSWSQDRISESESQFVFCHRDLSQSNIFIDSTTLRLVAIADWECGGYYPKNHELPFFESSIKSGAQARTISGMEDINAFWKDVAC